MFQLRSYQERPVQETITILDKYGWAYLAAETRTGKGLMSLYIAQQQGATKVLFVSKKKNLKNIEKDRELLSPSYTLITSTYAGVHKVGADFDFVILDEAHNMGQIPKPGTRTRTIRDIIEEAYRPKVLLMSATPCPENFGQLFHQVWVTGRGPWQDYRNYYEWFRDGYGDTDAQKDIGYGDKISDWAAVYKEQVFRDFNKYKVNLTQAEAGFQQEVRDEVMMVPFPTRMKNAYTRLRKEEIIKFKDGLHTVCNGPADVMQKLRQLSSGTLLREDGKAVIVSDHKVKAIKHRFQNKRIAILYYFRRERDLLLKHFPNATEDAHEFEKGASDTFIGQVRSSREGVKLSTADYLIMLTIDYSATSYQQARNRLQDYHRSKEPVVVWVLSEGTIEGKVYKTVRSKRSYTVAMYRRENLVAI